MQNKHVVDAAQTLGFSCNDFADEVKTKNFEVREISFSDLQKVFAL